MNPTNGNKPGELIVWWESSWMCRLCNGAADDLLERIASVSLVVGCVHQMPDSSLASVQQFVRIYLHLDWFSSELIVKWLYAKAIVENLLQKLLSQPPNLPANQNPPFFKYISPRLTTFPLLHPPFTTQNKSKCSTYWPSWASSPSPPPNSASSSRCSTNKAVEEADTNTKRKTQGVIRHGIDTITMEVSFPALYVLLGV